ncbi:MAG: hypothetical protein J6W77_06390, partial [Prevotella sp.]|nr:hypothetical protein [Prevotella sp.]
MKRFVSIILFVFVCIGMKASSDSIMVCFDFLSTLDVTGKYYGYLHSGASLSTYYNRQVLDLGSDNGYFEFDANIGELIGTLDDNYAISVNVFIPEETDLSENGQFIWCFANSSSDGYLFLSAKDSRFAITKTDYNGEETFVSNNKIEKGRWYNLIVMQRSSYARILVDGKSTSFKINLRPSDIGNTKMNYLGKSCYEGDAYLKNAKYSDFRIFNYSLDSKTIISLWSSCEELNEYEDSLRLVKLMNSFTMPDMSELVNDVTLPSVWNDIKITWKSSNERVITSDGHISRPPYGNPKSIATLTATLTSGKVTVERTFEVGVLPEYSDAEIVSRDMEWLQLDGRINHLYEQVTLPTVGRDGSVIFWKSSQPEWLSHEGKVMKQPETEDMTVILEATIMRGQEKATKEFRVNVSRKDPYDNYLFVYFPSNSNENIYYAISNDGFNYTPLNWGNRVVSADSIALKKGV